MIVAEVKTVCASTRKDAAEQTGAVLHLLAITPLRRLPLGSFNVHNLYTSSSIVHYQSFAEDVSALKL